MPETYLRLQEHLRCRLHLYCVLAAIPKLLRLVPEAQALVAKEQFSVQFATRSGLKATLRFEHGAAHFEAEASSMADIGLYFLTDVQVNKLFMQTGISVPLPVRGLAQMHKMKIFKKVADCLHLYLKPDAAMLKEDAALQAHVRLLLGLVVRATTQLVMHDPEAKRLMQHCPEGVAAFSAEEDVEAAWLTYRHGHMDSGFGTPPEKPDVHVRFRDSSIALKALNDELDIQAEVGLGNIRVEGLSPLADALGVIMQRIPDYLDV